MAEQRSNSRWQPGQSGNPNGRAVDAKLAEFRKAIAEHVPDIIRQMATQAINGDTQAARLLLERAIPVVRPEASKIVLPELEQAEGFTAKADALLTAIAQGELAPDVAAHILTGLAQAARTTEIDELERRILALEAPV